MLINKEKQQQQQQQQTGFAEIAHCKSRKAAGRGPLEAGRCRLEAKVLSFLPPFSFFFFLLLLCYTTYIYIYI